MKISDLIYKISFLSISILCASSAQADIVAPSSLKLTAYELWASTATNCSNPVKVIDNGTSGKVIDIATSTDFGTASLPPDGTYVCLIAVVDDTYTIVPATSGQTSGGSLPNNNCIAGQNFYTRHLSHRKHIDFT